MLRMRPSPPALSARGQGIEGEMIEYRTQETSVMSVVTACSRHRTMRLDARRGAVSGGSALPDGDGCGSIPFNAWQQTSLTGIREYR